jgi:SAM-dependent methyltransferase
MTQVNDNVAARFGLKGHLQSYLNLFLEFYDIRGKDVLEIGGAMPRDLVIQELGASSWTAVQSAEYASQRGDNQIPSENEDEGKYRSVFENIENLNDDLTFNSSFDVVFSIACFEHIHRFPEALQVMYRALRPCGRLFTAFAPIWSGPWGHHYDFGIPDRFDIIKPLGGWNSQNIFGPWDHLVMSRTQFYDLYSKKFDDDFSRQLTYIIYNSTHINRFFFEDYKFFIDLSSFKILLFQGVFSMSDRELTINAVKFLQNKFAGQGYLNFTDAGIVAFLEK